MHPHTYNQFYSWSETTVSVQHSGRSPGLKIIASAIFPVSQWSIGFSSLITVTSSCRTYTCFPFHRSQLLTWLLRHLNTPYSIVATISQIFWNCNVNHRLGLPVQIYERFKASGASFSSMFQAAHLIFHSESTVVKLIHLTLSAHYLF